MITREDAKVVGWSVRGFRHYRPASRLNSGLVASAPWVGVALVVGMYMYFLAPNVLQPGVSVALPETVFRDGRHYGHNMAVLSLPVAGQTDREELFFFDDQRYKGNEPAEMDALRSALATACTRKPDLPLVIEADRKVQHETLVKIYDMAANAGFREVNLATRPSER